jgi:hypothetical protein
VSLHRIGYWKAKFSDRYPVPQWVAGAISVADSELIARYLGAGWGVFQSFGVSWCRFGCGHFGSAESSDGVWCWPDGLSHYVREHRVALPVDFVEHVRKRRAPVRTEPIGPTSIDESLWLSWAGGVMTPAREARLLRAQAEFVASVAAIVDPEIERLERTVGVAEKPCGTDGCTGRRLRSGPMCSRCFAFGMAQQLPTEHAALVRFLQSASAEDA